MTTSSCSIIICLFRPPEIELFTHSFSHTARNRIKSLIQGTYPEIELRRNRVSELTVEADERWLMRLSCFFVDFCQCIWLVLSIHMFLAVVLYYMTWKSWAERSYVDEWLMKEDVAIISKTASSYLTNYSLTPTHTYSRQEEEKNHIHHTYIHT